MRVSQVGLEKIICVCGLEDQRQLNWMACFLNSGTGHIIRLSLARNYQVSCIQTFPLMKEQKNIRILAINYLLKRLTCEPQNGFGWNEVLVPCLSSRSTNGIWSSTIGDGIFISPTISPISIVPSQLITITTLRQLTSKNLNRAHQWQKQQQ